MGSCGPILLGHVLLIELHWWAKIYAGVGVQVIAGVWLTMAAAK